MTLCAGLRLNNTFLQEMAVEAFLTSVLIAASTKKRLPVSASKSHLLVGMLLLRFPIPTVRLSFRIYVVEIARLSTCQGLHPHWRPIGGAIGGVIGGGGGIFEG